MSRAIRFVSPVVLSIAFLPLAWAQGRAKGKHEPIDPAGIARLVEDSGGNVEVSVHDATGAARFVRATRGQRLGRPRQAARAASADAKKEQSAEFLQSYGSVFGIANVSSELKDMRTAKDRQGGTHITYQQVYDGLPVFGGELRSHFNASDELVAVNGTFVPDILVDSIPRRTADEAGRTALAKVERELGAARKLSVAGATLLVFREGLAQGVDGPNHLAWQVEVTDRAGVREFVYVDAQTGKFIDQITGAPDGLYRRAYDGLGPPNGVPASYPDSPFWVESDPFPTTSAEADNMILSSKDTYDFYSKAFGRDSFDGAGGIMDSIFNRGYSCPNASWNGTFISFCLGLTTDDVTGHEWSHAYTQYTDNLIYQWQPGALNESYSDIFGETIDRINGRGTDTPNNPRGADKCSTFGGTPPPTLTITGGSAAGTYFSRASVNEPPAPFTVGPLAMALSDPAGACTPIVSDVAGKIAIIDWTLTPSGGNECGSGARATNARTAGALGIIFVAPPAGLLNLGSSAAIASVEVTNADGANIKAGLPAQATISFAVGTDDSVRWLLGEDDTAVGLSGPLRDMWNPRCFGNPGKVSDTFEYTCSTADGGGVHTNSGVPNHAYALLVDGGTYNGQTITGIGLTKAAHIYFRAESVYQGPDTDFAEHADALDQSCSDLIGTNLADLTTGAPSGQIISASDCAQLAKVALAVELRSPPAHCNFQPILAKNPPPLCDAGSFATSIFEDDFERGNGGGHWNDDLDNGSDAGFDASHKGGDKDDGDRGRDDDHDKSGDGRWRVSHGGTTADFTPREWEIVSGLPGDRSGKAFFGADPDIGTCAPGGDESAVLHLDSPKITIPASVKTPMLTFDHWVATEADWDGGNLKISVNGGDWQIVQPGDFVYNPYNTTLATVDDGSTDPIAGEPAFSGTDGGNVGGSWGRSIINLAPYAKPKDKIRLRFDIGNDGCSGIVGWFIDDLMVYQCHSKGHGGGKH
jgi:Zn-dependent metalloprotease